MRNETKEIIIMNFSGIYEEMEFWKGRKARWLEVKELPGTNCYCDESARKALLRQTEGFFTGKVRFLDSGNYHYMSRLWLEQISEPFCLVVFDNHTDMQPPAFGEILSCGGWIADSLRELPNLKKVILLGPDEEAFSQTDPELRKKVLFFSRERLAACREGGQALREGGELREFFEKLPKELPVSLSIDKDILCPEAADTNWSQGDMTLEELLEILAFLCGYFFGRILGVDVCGESEPGKSEHTRNDMANKKILALLEREGVTYEE